MQAIQTCYRGYRFRSRLEARWAVFFDALRLSWEYEPEGFDLGGGELYLPDFRVVSPQGAVTWYEVKPSSETTSEKLDQFKLRLREEVDFPSAVLLSGDPGWVLYERTPRQYDNGCGDDKNYVCPRCGIIEAPAYDCYSQLGADEDYWYFGCEPCDLNTPTGVSPIERGLIISVCPSKGLLKFDSTSAQHWLRTVERAAMYARGARFDHAEGRRMARIT